MHPTAKRVAFMREMPANQTPVAARDVRRYALVTEGGNMRVILHTDNTLPLPIEPLCKMLNSICKEIEFIAGSEKLRIDVPQILSESIYLCLPKRLLEEAKVYDLAFLSTNVPYENNYFCEIDWNPKILSFNSWNMYTDLPVTNGLFYFIAKILAGVLKVGEMHEENSGCLNDFLWDKRGVDVGMRAAFICGRCRTNYVGKPELLRDIENILNLLSSASRSGKDVLSLEPVSISPQDISFDVFLCHNSEDKELIREINKALQSAGVITWLDEEQLKPGQLWQAELEEQIGKIKNACVFVGKNSRGPWQDFEIRAFLNEFVNRGGAVIPVILPDASEIPNLPIFLKQMMWVDLRKDYEKSLLKLIGALHPRASA
jgi:hypothetical protein